MHRWLAIPALMVALVVVACAPAAPSYPQKPVTLIVNYAPGGGSDVTARALAAAMTPDMGQEVVVVNRPGGTATIGPTEVIQSKPDGYTIGIATNSPLSISSLVIQGLPWGPPSDYDILAGVGTSYGVLAGRPEAPYKTFQELVAYAKANPGKVKIGSAGKGGVNHVAWVQVAKAANIDVTYVPFTGEADVIPALLGGHVDLYGMTQGGILPHIQAGKATALGVWGPERSPSLPDVPTFKDLGINSTLASQYVVFAPKGLQAPVRQKIVDVLKKAIASDTFKEKTAPTGLVVIYRTPDQGRALIEGEYNAMKDLLPTLDLS